MRKPKWVVLVIALVLGLSLIFASCAPAVETAAEFYKGKTIEFNVPYDAGNPEDLTVREIAPLIAQYTGASTVRVVNRTGGEGIDAWNRVYEAEPDGLTLGFGSASSQAIANIFGDPAARFETDKYTYLVGIPSDPLVIVVASDGTTRSINDLKATTVTAGTYSIDGNYGLTLLTVFHIFSLEGKIVGGISFNERMLMASRGELDASITSVSGATFIMSGGIPIEPLFIMSPQRVAQFPDVPSWRELLPGASGEILDMMILAEEIWPAGDSILTTPDLPDDRVVFLREAVVAALQEKHARIVEIREIEFEALIPGDEVQAMAAELLAPEMQVRLKSIFGELIAKYT